MPLIRRDKIIQEHESEPYIEIPEYSASEVWSESEGDYSISPANSRASARRTSRGLRIPPPVKHERPRFQKQQPSIEPDQADHEFGHSTSHNTARRQGFEDVEEAQEEANNRYHAYKCHPYKLPRGIERNIRGPPRLYNIWMEVLIRGATGSAYVASNGMGTWPWPGKSGFSRVATGQVHLCHATTAKRWDDEGNHQLDFTTTHDLGDVEDEAACAFRWLHVQTEKLDFDEFRTIALNRPGLSRDWKIVLLSLLKRIREVAKTHDENSWKPWAMRADSAELTMPKRYDANLTAISLSIPFFALGVKPQSGKVTTHQFPGSGLFGSVVERNFEQLFPRMVNDGDRENQFIYAAHIWCLVFDRTLITYGPISYDELKEGPNSMLNTKSITAKPARIVQVTDEWGCTYVLALEECDSFFALQSTVEKRCLQSSNLCFSDIELCTQDNLVLTGTRWLIMIKTEKFDKIKLSMRKKRIPDKLELQMGTRILPDVPDLRRESIKREVRQERRKKSSIGDEQPKTRHLSAITRIDPPRYGRRSLFPAQETESRGLDKDSDDYGINLALAPLSVSLNEGPTDSGHESTETEASKKHLELDSESLDVNLTESTKSIDSRSLASNGSSDEGINPIESSSRKQLVHKNTHKTTPKRSVWQPKHLPRKIGAPTSTTLVTTRREQKLQRDLRLNWKAEGVVYDISSWIAKRNINFYADPIVRQAAQMKLEAGGLVVFDTKTNPLPSAYRLPKPTGARQAPENHQLEHNKQLQQVTRERSVNEVTASVPASNISDSDLGDEKSQNLEASSEHDTDVSSVAIPRFLEWHTADMDDEAELGDLPPADYTERVLQAVHEDLSNTKRADRADRAGAYKWVEQCSHADLLQAHPHLRTSAEHETTGSLSAGATRKQFLPNKQSSVLHEEHSGSPGVNNILDKVHAELHRKCDQTVLEMYRLFARLLDCYLEPSSDHALVLKLWGAFRVILLKLANCEKDTSTPSAEEPVFWVARDVSSDPSYMKQYKPRLKWEDCQYCSSGTIWQSQEDGLRHIHEVHFRDRRKGKLPNDDSDEYWLRNDQEYRIDQRLELYLRYLEITVSYLQAIYTKARLLRAGAASNSGQTSPRYRLPTTLLKAFENITMLLMYTATSFPLVDSFCRRLIEHTQSKETKNHHQLVLDQVRDNIDVSGSAAILLLEKAEGDLILMAHTELDNGVVSYDSVGPEYVLAAVMATLFSHPLHNNETADKIYTSYYEKLRMEVLRHPRARVLHDIYLMREEISEFLRWGEIQSRMFMDYANLLAPCSYKITTRVRCVRFAAEYSFLQSRYHHHENTGRDWIRLDARLFSLENNVFQMLNINNENSSNAIMVFTIVATIFLPLSWATSYLGMNTADVRNLEQGQWLFWTIAGPVAALVIGVALVTALKGEAIREYMIERRHRSMTKKTMEPEAGVSRMNTMMSGILNARTRTGTELAANSWPRMRHRRKVKVEGHV